MFNEEPLWTNSMFGGMPATQVSVVHGGNLMNQVFRSYNTMASPPC